MKRPSMYSRPDKPLSVSVPRRDWMARTIERAELAAPVVVHAGSECHVTPPRVAERMADYAGSLIDCDVLEPSAGTGNLARAILANGCALDRLTLVEMHTGLADGLRSIAPVVCTDFIEWAKDTTQRFDIIIMNPPFSRVRAHVAAALSLLRDQGRLIALVPITFNRDDCETLEELPNDTFAAAKVNTKIIELSRLA